MGLINLTSKQDENKPLKRSMTGLELELHITDRHGNISYSNLELIKKIKLKYPEVVVVKECGASMIELGCYPHSNAYNPAMEVLTSLEKMIDVANENGFRYYPFSTYPGKMDARMTLDPNNKYAIQEKILGKERFSMALKVTGFHHHYALPKGVFDQEKKNLRLFVNSKLKRSLLNSYNFEIAIDPAITLLTQSSPFFEGRLVAKDARMLVYRGGKKLRYDGVYSRFQQVGALPPYKHTGTDLIRSLKKRQQRWQAAVRRADKNVRLKALYASPLDISWNPVKINKHGTLEARGMDMNYMSVILGVSVLIKSCLKKIQREFVEVIPSDTGIKDAFRFQNGILCIPPHTYVRGKLQKASAYRGFDSDFLYDYTRKFFFFAKSITPGQYLPLLKHVESMIKKRMSVSDRIIKFARKKNLVDESGNVSDKGARKMARHYSKKFERNLKKTKAIVEKVGAECRDTMHKE